MSLVNKLRKLSQIPETQTHSNNTDLWHLIIDYPDEKVRSIAN